MTDELRNEITIKNKQIDVSSMQVIKETEVTFRSKTDSIEQLIELAKKHFDVKNETLTRK